MKKQFNGCKSTATEIVIVHRGDRGGLFSAPSRFSAVKSELPVESLQNQNGRVIL